VNSPTRFVSAKIEKSLAEKGLSRKLELAVIHGNLA
jgi:hypothetical protein